jgi:hypothetical protein
VVAGLVILAARRARWAAAALVVVTAADLGIWGYRFIYREAPRAIADLTAAIPPAPASPAEAYAAGPLNGPYKANVLVLRGYRLTNGYVGLFPATQLPLDGERARRLSGTRWVFTDDGARHAVADGVARARLLDDGGQEAPGSARDISSSTSTCRAAQPSRSRSAFITDGRSPLTARRKPPGA